MMAAAEAEIKVPLCPLFLGFLNPLWKREAVRFSDKSDESYAANFRVRTRTMRPDNFSPDSAVEVK
jgi:hypothetical protein